MTIIDNTNGKKPNENQEYKLTVEFHTGVRYVYYGETKKEALKKFQNRFGGFSGFISKEWSIEDK